MDSIPRWGRPPGGGNGNPLQNSWTEEPGELQSVGSQRIGLSTRRHTHTHIHTTGHTHTPRTEHTHTHPVQTAGHTHTQTAGHTHTDTRQTEHTCARTHTHTHTRLDSWSSLGSPAQRLGRAGPSGLCGGRSSSQGAKGAPAASFCLLSPALGEACVAVGGRGQTPGAQTRPSC